MRSPCSISAARWPPERLKRSGSTRRWSVLTSAAEQLLSVGRLESGYGKIRVLHGIDLTVSPGDGVAVLGANATPREAARAGLVHVIEGHRVFTQISVTDNLLLAGYDLPRGERTARVEEALSYFPEIAEKRHERGGALSGGQQQMLTVAQGLVRRPRLLMLDEPSAGLSPVLVDRVLNVIGQLRKQGTAVLLVEQLLEKALAAADRVYALVQGHIVLEAPTSEADLAQRLERAYFGHEAKGDVAWSPDICGPAWE